MLKSQTIISFYKFISIDNNELNALQLALKKICQTLNILGTIILAKEGMNATLVGTSENIHAFLEQFKMLSIDQNQILLDLKPEGIKYSIADKKPFQKLKVTIKKEIVTFGVPDINPINKTGKHIKPENWNALISDPEVLVIDTRNHFEIHLGTFKNAIDPQTKHFRDFPKFVAENLDKSKHKKIALFCTGGIRCEKASAYLLEQGFKDIYQLEGGILKYLEKLKDSEIQETLWQGECFIFDDRVIFDPQTIKK